MKLTIRIVLALAMVLAMTVMAGATEVTNSLADREAIQQELNSLKAQIEAEMEGGLTPSDAIIDQISAIEQELYPGLAGEGRNVLDQGSETCDQATVIPATPYCTVGVMGETDDCTISSTVGANSSTIYRDVFYQYAVPVGQGGWYTVSMCGSLDDTWLRVWQGTCCSGTAYAADNDSCTGYDPRRRLQLTEGTTYYFELGYRYATAAAQAYNFNLFGPHAVPGTPAPPAPVNDLCTGAVAIGSVPFSYAGTIIGSATEVQTSNSCGGTTSSYGGVWFTYTGTGHFITARTDNNCSTFNSRVRVYSGTCTALTCVGGSDDVSTTNSLSSFTWCGAAGTTYIIIVSSYYNNDKYYGPYKLEVFEGDICDCSQVTACGTPMETTAENGTCPTAVDPYVMECNGLVYGTICPGTDVDVFPVTVPAMTAMYVMIADGPNCDTQPTVCMVLDILNGSCANVATAQHTGWSISNPTAAPVTYYAKVRSVDGGCYGKYKLTSTCCQLHDYCADPVVIVPPIYHFSMDFNTCCATNPIPSIYQLNCGGTLGTSGNDAIVKFTVWYAAHLSIRVTAAGAASEQALLFKDPSPDCATYTCVASSDTGFATVYPEGIDMLVPAGTYYVAGSYYGTGCGMLNITIDSDVPLPVELGDVSATGLDNAVLVKWDTRSETSLDKWLVKRDGTTIYTVTANNGSSGHHYSFTDNGAVNGRTYSYDLVVKASDGTETVVKTLSATPTIGATVVDAYALHQNYPNPFNPTTDILYDLKDASLVTLKVYNLMGQEVATLVNGNMTQGRHVVSFDGTNLTSGLYVCKMTAGSFTAEMKMLLMK